MASAWSSQLWTTFIAQSPLSASTSSSSVHVNRLPFSLFQQQPANRQMNTSEMKTKHSTSNSTFDNSENSQICHPYTSNFPASSNPSSTSSLPPLLPSSSSLSSSSSSSSSNTYFVASVHPSQSSSVSAPASGSSGSSPSSPDIISLDPNILSASTSTAEHKQCERFKEKSLHSNIIGFMIRQLDRDGSTMDPSLFIRCVACNRALSGAFFVQDDPSTSNIIDRGIIMCENHLTSFDHFKVTLTHELIHAYDHWNYDVDFHSNCLHHACTEVRATNLSGNCTFMREVKIGNISFSRHHDECVKRRATSSVMANPRCTAIAKQSVETVFKRCVKDVLPFRSVPW